MISCDPSVLMQRAACYRCVADQGWSILIYLACALVQKKRPNLRFAYTPASAIVTWDDAFGLGQTGNLAQFHATADIPTVNQIQMSGTGINTITGLSTLPALAALDVSGNNLTALDLTGCTALMVLYCGINPMVSLDVRPATNLTQLSAQNGFLTTLNVSGLQFLQFIDCDANSLTALDLSTCPSLIQADIYANLFSLPNSINITGLTALTALTADDCLLTGFDASVCTGLLTLSLNNNNLVSLTVNPSLNILNVGGNALVGVDVSGCSFLQAFVAHNNLMTDIDVDGCPIMDTLSCPGNVLTNVRIGVSPNYVFVDAHDNLLPTTGPIPHEGVDDILNRLANNCLANLGYCDLDSPGNAVPTNKGPGSDYDLLVTAGWTVLVN